MDIPWVGGLRSRCLRSGASAWFPALALLNTGVHTVRERRTRRAAAVCCGWLRRGISALAAEWLPPMLAAGSARSAENSLPCLIAMVEARTPDSRMAGQINALF